MKHFGSLCILLILVHFSTQITRFVNCPKKLELDTGCECCEVTCSSKGSQWIAIPCSESLCQPGKQIGYHEEDLTKVYPACCGYPICKTD